MPGNPIPDELRSDHTFLLVGANPLPDWIAAKLLLREGGQLYLIHSTTMDKVANRLAHSATAGFGAMSPTPSSGDIAPPRCLTLATIKATKVSKWGDYSSTGKHATCLLTRSATGTTPTRPGLLRPSAPCTCEEPAPTGVQSIISISNSSANSSPSSFVSQSQHRSGTERWRS